MSRSRHHVIRLRVEITDATLASLCMPKGRTAKLSDMRDHLRAVIDDEIEHIKRSAELEPLLEKSVALAKRKKRAA